jgi:glycerophosphoryl diester phosphodiesterase
VEIIGHRGQVEVGGPPENTLDAVDAAFEAGADGVEVDVRLTSDAVPVCLHDPDLRRLAGRAVLVHEATYAQLRTVRLSGGATVAALEDVLALSRGRGRIVLDVKDDAGSPEPLARAALGAVRATGTGDAVLFSSFSPAALSAAARLAPGIRRALISTADVPLERAAASAAQLGCEGLHPRLRTVLDDPRSPALRSGLRIRPWTVNRRVDAVCLDALGVPAVITDRPGELHAAARALAPAG